VDQVVAGSSHHLPPHMTPVRESIFSSNLSLHLPDLFCRLIGMEFVYRIPLTQMNLKSGRDDLGAHFVDGRQPQAGIRPVFRNHIHWLDRQLIHTKFFRQEGTRGRDRALVRRQRIEDLGGRRRLDGRGRRQSWHQHEG
jgi:hypothetical protein